MMMRGLFGHGGGGGFVRSSSFSGASGACSRVKKTVSVSASVKSAEKAAKKGAVSQSVISFLLRSFSNDFNLKRGFILRVGLVGLSGVI